MITYVFVDVLLNYCGFRVFRARVLSCGMWLEVDGQWPDALRTAVQSLCGHIGVSSHAK